MEKKQTAVELLVEQVFGENTNYYLQWKLEIEQALEMEKEQHQETWDSAHQAGRFEGKGIAEENWQTFETHWEETFK